MSALPLWIEFFEDLQHVRGRSLNTIMAYRRDLELYVGFKKINKPVSAFYDFMKKNKLSTRSQARVISSLRTYFRFLEGRGIRSPELIELRPPKVKVGLPKTLSVDEFNRLYASCLLDDGHRSSRNQMTLLLLYGLGCRVSELTGLGLEDFSQTDRTLKILGKGNKERMVPLTERLYDSLIAYLKFHRNFLNRDDKNRSLLINDRGHRPSRVDIWRWLATWSAKAGFDEPVSPHRFRHACATALLESGSDLRSIQILLGHASIQTTQIYTNVTTQNLTKTVEENHPLAKLDVSKEGSDSVI
jgi:integrase/recombinase XerD